jgi:hypothetical protein
VGKRLAVDPAKGRLWVVCSHCERWNLLPLEERWEAIEAAEKLYRDTRRRVATDNIGLAKLADGTTLVRIGEPLRPEFAAWRYGDQFGRRRRRRLLVAGGGAAALAALVSTGVATGVGIGLFGAMLGGAINVASGRPESVVAKIRTNSGSVLYVRRRHLGETWLARDENGELAINLRFKNGQGTFVGREAERIAAIVLPKVNRFGGDKAAVADAVREIESMGSAERYLDHLSTVGAATTKPLKSGPGRQWWRGSIANGYSRTGLFALPKAHRLALEMALNEEIAGIADSLLLPDDVAVSANRLRTNGDGR